MHACIGTDTWILFFPLRARHVFVASVIVYTLLPFHHAYRCTVGSLGCIQNYLLTFYGDHAQTMALSARSCRVLPC